MASVPAKTSQSTPKPGRHRKPDQTESVVSGATTVGQAIGSKKRGSSTSRKAVHGAATGAATGAAVGSVIPGVGTAVGAGVGAAMGGASGAIDGRNAKRAAKAESRAERGSGTRLLIAEFVACMIILGLSPLAQKDGQAVAPKDWMKRATAICALFVILGTVAAVGPKTAKTASAFGGLVLLVLMVDQRSIFGVIAAKLKTTGTADVTSSGPPLDTTAPPSGNGGGVWPGQGVPPFIRRIGQ